MSIGRISIGREKWVGKFVNHLISYERGSMYENRLSNN